MKSSVSSPKPPNFAIRKKIPSYTTAKSQRKIITVCCWSSAARRKIGPSLYDTMITLPNRWWMTWVKQIVNPRKPITGLHVQLPARTSIIISDNITLRDRTVALRDCCPWLNVAIVLVWRSKYEAAFTPDPARCRASFSPQHIKPHSQRNAWRGTAAGANAVLTTVKHNVDKTWLDDEIMGGHTRTRAYVRRDARTTPKHNASGPVCCTGEGIKTTVRSSR